MGRVKLCSIILVILVIISIGTLWLIDVQCDQLSSQISEVQILCERKETTLALEKTDALNRSWNRYYKVLACLVKHDKLSEINAIIARIRPLILNDSNEISAEFGSALYQIDLLRETEFPYLHNIL